jgi:hypothetical protein
MTDFKLHKKKRRKQQVINQKLRRQLLDKVTHAHCCYCGNLFSANELTIEHKIPICMGGSSEISNIALACAPCNRAKGKEAFLYLRKLNKRKYQNVSKAS